MKTDFDFYYISVSYVSRQIDKIFVSVHKSFHPVRVWSLTLRSSKVHIILFLRESEFLTRHSTDIYISFWSITSVYDVILTDRNDDDVLRSSDRRLRDTE